MKVLLVHNHYQLPGGEDSCYAAEGQLLESAGHQVVRYTRHNDDIHKLSAWTAARLTVWNNRTFHEVRRLIQQERPDVMHCTNTFPLISPAVYYAARAEGVAVVQALHNYRLLCPNALLLRDQSVCEDCLGRTVPWPSVKYRCYRDNRAASAVVAAMLLYHRLRGTYQRAVDRYYALTEFARTRFVAGGLPADKLMVKPNFVVDPNREGGGKSDYCIYVGRLSQEKGITTLLEAWKRTSESTRLKIVGDGPLRAEVQSAVASDSRIEWLGQLPSTIVTSLIAESLCLVLPSICFENFPRTIVEAYSVGTPVVASRMGSMIELVHHGRTGLLFEPRDATDLAAQIHALCAAPASQSEWREAARAAYLDAFTPERNLQILLDIYQAAIDAQSSCQVADDKSALTASAIAPRPDVVPPLPLLNSPVDLSSIPSAPSSRHAPTP